tara:strand:- start:289 stop:603 length:315 start_codon:yes stop_codon:yes gene_type:complete
MSRVFNEEEAHMLSEAAREVEEFYYEMRKGVPQTKYVFEITKDATWLDPDNDYTPTTLGEEYLGFWVMVFADDLRHTRLDECIRDAHWARCYKKEVTTYEWEEL